MKKSWLFHTALVVLCLMAGCQKYWYQEGKTFDECKADWADCRAELAKRTDLNYVGDYERRFLENCMQERGYRLVPQKDLPLDVRREEPNLASDMPWDWADGVAGRLSK
jgi:hypothetical protein